MIDAKFLNYEFDEERGFGKPNTPLATHGSRNPVQMIAAGMVAIGVACFVATYFMGAFLGPWGSLLASHGSIIVGALVYFIAKYKRIPVGIHHDGTMFGSTVARGVIGWTLAILMSGFYVILYFRYELIDSTGRDFIAPMVDIMNPLAQQLRGARPDHWFLYGFLYSALVMVFGVRMLLRYRNNRYQLIRTCSVIFFQLILAFLIPNLMILFDSKEYYFTYFWPLKQVYLFPQAFDEAIDVVVFFFYWSLFMSVIATPILTYLYGKRWYCSWVCGCGGLAETLGDPWRQLSNKSDTAWHIERWLLHAVLIAITVGTALLWVNSWSEGQVLGNFSLTFSKLYGLWIGMIFSGVVGVGFYPLLGSRVWCRFGCPMAAILGIFQRVKSRFRITTNGGQCMSCGNCSTYCEMGIDVRAYAQRRENIVRASCVGCGVCSAVCPRGVLKLENGPARDRYEGDGNPIASFIRDIAHSPQKDAKFTATDR